MIRNTANDYAEYLKVDISKQLNPLSDLIDDMLTRLEEFESMVTFVQQERGNVVGLTGTLTKVVDSKAEFEILCSKIDVIESLIANVKGTLDSLDEQVHIAEEQHGLSDAGSLKNFLIPKMFKKSAEVKPSAPKESKAAFKTDDYFSTNDEAATYPAL